MKKLIANVALAVGVAGVVGLAGTAVYAQQKDADNSTFGVMGELSLDGQVLPVRGALPLALGLRKTGIRKLKIGRAHV